MVTILCSRIDGEVEILLHGIGIVSNLWQNEAELHAVSCIHIDDLE